MYLRLTIRSRPAETRPRKHCVTLNELGGTIGRASDCDLILPDPYISRVHASILFIDGAFHLRNESINGVYLSSGHELLEPGEQARLRNGDVVQIGEFSLQVEITEQAIDGAAIDADTGATFDKSFADISAPDTAEPYPASPPPAQHAPEPLPDGAFDPGEDYVAVLSGEALSHTAKRKTGDTVDVAVFGPQALAAGRSELIDVWLFGRGDFEVVKRLSAQVERGRSYGHKAGLSVAHGAIIELSLSMSGVEVIESRDTLIWTGEPASASFVVQAPIDPGPGDLVGTVAVSIDGVRLGKVTFVAPLTSDTSSRYQAYEREFERIKTAFASYASADRADVLARLQGMRALSPTLDVFLDVLTLRAGEDWEARLREEIPSRDAFYLFWSQHAADSIWVTREWRMALDTKGLDYIVPVPLQDPCEAPPPEALNSLHFNDAYLAHITYLRLRGG